VVEPLPAVVELLGAMEDVALETDEFVAGVVKAVVLLPVGGGVAV